MVKVKEQELLDKGLTQADIQEFKDTWSFSDTATAKVKEIVTPTETLEPVQTITQTETKPVMSTEVPKQTFEQQIDEQLDSWKSIAEVRDTIKSSGKLSTDEFNRVDNYLAQKITPTEIPKEVATTTDVKQVTEPIITEKEKVAVESWIDFTKKPDWSIRFNPDTLDDVFDLYNRFGSNVKISKNSFDTIKWKTAFDKISNFRWLDANSLYKNLVNWQISTDWAAWQYLTKINGWQPTAEMLDAKQQYDLYLDKETQKKLDNQLFSSLSWETSSQDFISSINDLNEKIINDFSKNISDISSKYNLIENSYKEGSQETKEAFQKSNNLATELQGLYDERNDIIKNVKKQYPNLSTATQLLIAKDQLENIEWLIKWKEREYNNAKNNWQFLKDLDLSTYENQLRSMDREVGFMNQIFSLNKQKTDFLTNYAIKEFDFNRQEAWKADQFNKQVELANLQFEREYEKAIKLKQFDLAAQIKLNQEKLKNEASKMYHDQKTGLLVKVDDAWNIVAKVDFNKLAWNQNNGSFLSKVLSDYYSGYNVTQKPWDKSPNSKDNWYNWWTPWIDLAMAVWTDIKSTAEWEVIFVWKNWDYWNQVVIKDKNGKKHYYSHLSEASVKKWDMINSGDTIAKSWNTWFSTGPHLDYRVKSEKNKWEDPTPYISETPAKKWLANLLTWNAWLPLSDLSDIILQNPNDLVKSGQFEYLGTNAKELSLLQRELKNDLQEMAKKFNVNDYNEIVTWFGWTLTKMSDKDLWVTQWGLIQAMLTGDEWEVKRVIANKILQSSDKNGIDEVLAQSRTIWNISNLIGSINKKINEQDANTQKAIRTNLINWNIAGVQQLLWINTELTELRSQIDFLSDGYRLWVTGQASTDQELARILNKFPKITNTNELNRNLIDSYVNFFTWTNLTSLETKLNKYNMSLRDIDPTLSNLYNWVLPWGKIDTLKKEFNMGTKEDLFLKNKVNGN